jgi:hypothetical protein
MNRIPVFLSLILLVGSTAASQDGVSVKQTTKQELQHEGGTKSQNAELTSPLRELKWMVGRWIDQGEAATITTQCSWAHKGKFLKRSFSVASDGEVTLEGTQFIGWDPLAGQIHSWTFDSEGGHGQGRWSQDGDRWLVKTAFVLAGGERASAINVITYVDQDTLRWQSTNREIAGELQPNIPEVTVMRQQPKESESVRSEKEESQ